MKIKYAVVAIAFAINLCTNVNTERSEIFSSAELLRRSLEYVKTSDFLPYLKDYVTSRKVWLSRLSKVIQDIGELDDLLNEDKFSVEIPTYAYKFIRRQALISQDIHRFMYDIQRTAFDYKWMNDFMDHLPNSTDLLGSSQGLTRLVETYQLKGKDLLNGTIYGYAAKPLSAHEMYDIGKTLSNTKIKYSEKQYAAVLRWLNLASKKLTEENHQTIEEKDIIELKTNTYIKVGCLCSFEIDHVFNHSSLASRKLKLARQKVCKNNKKPCKPNVRKTHDKNLTSAFESLCRGELSGFQADMNVRISKSDSLKCYLIDNRNPILLLQPQKFEEVHTDKPYIAVLHDVLREREIQYFLDRATPRLARGTLLSKTGVTTSDTKISQQVFLPIKSYDKSIVNLRKRLAAATKLNVKGFEQIQVANYAAGGYYNFHIDSNYLLTTPKDKYLGKSNRLATMVMYISDVEEGGATTFPSVGAAVRPEKGSAAVFYNLHRNCQLNGDARHGGCPIISGEKWIATQWVTTIHQEFHHPCALNETA